MNTKTLSPADRRLLKHTEKDGNIVYGSVVKCDNFGAAGHYNYYLIPASIEAEFDSWAAKGVDDGEFDDYLPGGVMFDLMFEKTVN